MAVTDQGRWLTGRLLLGSDGRLAGITDADILPILMPDGSFVRATANMRDAEAVERLGDGSLIVAFEQNHRVWRYPTPTSPAEAYVGGADLAAQPDNGGIEAMAPLADGSLLLLSEEGRNAEGDHRGWLWRSGGLLPLSYAAEAGFAPTDIARLADGDLLVLERRFNPLTGFGARIVRLAGIAVVPGARLQGEEIARLEWPYLVENYEALAAAPAADGGSYVYLASDDNFNIFQSTLLLQFRLAP